MNVNLTPSLVLTTDHPEADVDVPVLLKLDAEEGQELYEPEDLLELGGETVEAAYHVRRLARGLTGEERAAAVAFLGQWPVGPQLDAPQEVD